MSAAPASAGPRGRGSLWHGFADMAVVDGRELVLSRTVDPEARSFAGAVIAAERVRQPFYEDGAGTALVDSRG